MNLNMIRRSGSQDRLYNILSPVNPEITRGRSNHPALTMRIIVILYINFLLLKKLFLSSYYYSAPT